MYNRYSNNRIRYTRHPNNRTKIEKRQTKLPFTKIILIILAILFIVLGIYGIKKLMETNDPPQTQEDINKLSNSEIISPQIDQFKSDFQKDINKVLRSFQYSQDFEYFLPETISKVCFEDDEFENMYFVPSAYGGDMLKNIDLEKTLKDSESICFDVYNGRVYMTLKKGYYGSKVTLVEKEYEKQEEVIFLCNGTWSQEYYWEGVYECDGNISGCNISSCLCNVGFSPDLIGGCDLDYGNITYICNGTWSQEYYWEGVYECDGNVSGCNISSCLCEDGFSPDLIGGCDLDYIEIPEPMTTVSFSRDGITAKANMVSELIFTATSVNENNIDVLFEDVSGIGFEFTGYPNSFEDVRSGNHLLQTAIVPEAAYPGQYVIRIGAIPSALVASVKANNGGQLPSLEDFPSLGFGIDDITLNVDGINYEPTIALDVVQDAQREDLKNTEGTADNPFHSGDIRLYIFIVEDSGFIGDYMPRWGIRKVSGNYCNPDSRYTLFGGNGLGAILIVPKVRDKVGIRIEATIIDGIHSVTTIRTIYVDPSPSGC